MKLPSGKGRTAIVSVYTKCVSLYKMSQNKRSGMTFLSCQRVMLYQNNSVINMQCDGSAVTTSPPTCTMSLFLSSSGLCLYQLMSAQAHVASQNKTIFPSVTFLFFNNTKLAPDFMEVMIFTFSHSINLCENYL